MFGPSFRTARCYPTYFRRIGKALGRSLNCTVRTVAASVFDELSATATDVFRFRMFYCGYMAVFDFPLVALSKTSCDVLPCEFGRMSGSGHGGRKFFRNI